MEAPEDRTAEVCRRVQSAFEDVYGDAARTMVVRAPGRVNLIGDHTDYNDGFVLPMPIDRAAYAAARARPDRHIEVHSARFGDGIRFDLDAPPQPPQGSWASYVVGVAAEMDRRAGLPRGVQMVIDGDVPIGAGLSSSASLEIAVAFALDQIFDIGMDAVEMAQLCQSVEHRYAGVECGIMDQFASRLGRPGAALLLDCRSLDCEHVPFHAAESGLAVLIADTRVHRELAASAYGVRRKECREAVHLLRSVHPGVESLRDVSRDELEAARTAMDDRLYRRARHVVEENDRVLQAAWALRSDAFEVFGGLMNDSHRSLRDGFEVSSPELDTLVEAAWRDERVVGARMTGGGFGGCSVHLVRESALESVQLMLRQVYERRHGRSPSFYVVDRGLPTERIA